MTCSEKLNGKKMPFFRQYKTTLFFFKLQIYIYIYIYFFYFYFFIIYYYYYFFMLNIFGSLTIFFGIFLHKFIKLI
jgi:hypothetical protein